MNLNDAKRLATALDAAARTLKSHNGDLDLDAISGIYCQEIASVLLTDMPEMNLMGFFAACHPKQFSKGDIS